MSDRPKIYYGLCEGGPFHQKHLADARAVFPIHIDVITKKVFPGAQAGARGTESSGDYIFEGKTWRWHPIHPN